jgi:hypothetical protein
MKPTTMKFIIEDLHTIRYSDDQEKVRFSFFNLGGFLNALFHEEVITVQEWSRLCEMNRNAHRHAKVYNQ